MSAKMNASYSMDQYASACMKQIEDMMSMGKQTSDAWMQSGSILAKGMEEVVKTCVTKAQDVNEKNANCWQTLMGCKSINELAEMQNKMAQEGFEEVMSASAQMSEMSVKCMMDAFEPLNKQMSVAMKKAGTACAA